MEKYNTGMVFGTFDLFHRGHEFYISEAKNQVKNLIIIVARDSRVKQIKNIIPHDNENLRVEKIQKRFPNNTVILGDENDIFAPIKEYKPEILFFGYDQKIPEKILSEKFPNIFTRRITSFEPHKYKSSILRKKIGNQKIKE